MKTVLCQKGGTLPLTEETLKMYCFLCPKGPGPRALPLGALLGGGGCINSPVPVRVKICFADFMPPIVIIFRTESSFKILGYDFDLLSKMVVYTYMVVQHLQKPSILR